MDPIESQIVEEIQLLLSSVDARTIADIQPPSTVLRLAAEAAAKVLIAFERGTRIGL